MRRRTFLAGAAGLGTAAVSGCTAGSSDGGVQTLADLGEWLVPPPEGYGIGSDYSVSHLSPSGFATASDALGEETVDGHVGGAMFPETGLTYADVDHRLDVVVPTRWYVPYAVLLGEFQGDAVLESLEGERTETVGSHGDYAFVRQQRYGYDFAVADGRIVAMSSGPDDEEVLTTVVETAAGDRERLLERNRGSYDWTRRVADRLPVRLAASLDRSSSDGGRPERGGFYDAYGTAATSWIENQRVERLELVAFTGGDVIHESSLETYVDALEGEDAWETADYEVDGSVVEVRTSAPVNDVPDGWTRP